MDRRADRRRPRAPRGAPRAIPAPNGSRRRSCSATSSLRRRRRARLRAEQLLFEQESLGWDIGARACAPRPRRRRRSAGGRRRTPTTASRWSSRSSTAATCALRGASGSTWPLARYLKHLPAGTWRGARASRSSASCRRCSTAARRGLGLEAAPMSTLLVDNHDSYTYNVFHLLAAASGEEPIVVHNDVVSWRALSRWKFDAFVLSPGPGRPERWHDFGVCADILRYSEMPVLGICLGHQGIGNLLDGGVASAPTSCTAASAASATTATGLFAGIPQGFSVVRYHSLAVTGPLGPEGRVDRLDRRRRRDGGRAPLAARSGACSSTPSRSPPSTATASSQNFFDARAPSTRRFARLPGSRGDPPRRDAGLNGARAAGRAPAGVEARRAAARARGRGRGAPTEHAVRTALRRGRARLLARQRRRADPAGAVLVPGHERRAASAACSSTTSTRRDVTIAPRRRDERSSTARSSTCSTASSKRRRRTADRRRPRACSAASSATSATSARPTAARPTCTAPTCPTRC